MSEASGVYKGDFRLEFDLRHNDYREYLKMKEFERFYQNVFSQLKQTRAKLTDENIEGFYKGVKKLHFPSIAKHMTLIDDNEQFQLFINYELTLDNGEKLLGKEVWETFKQLSNDKTMEFAERRVRLSAITEK